LAQLLGIKKMKFIFRTLQLFFFFLTFQIPTAIAASFDCTKASTQVEKLICSTSILGQLDIALSQNYRNIRASNIGDGARAALQTEQRDWMKQRNTCTTVVCIERIYRSRLDEICSVPVLSGVHPPCKYSEDIGSQPSASNQAGVSAESSQSSRTSTNNVPAPKPQVQNPTASSMSNQERMKLFNAGTHDIFGKPRDFSREIWVGQRTAVIGRANPNGKQLDDIIEQLAKLAAIRRQATTDAKAAEARRDPTGMNRQIELITRTEPIMKSLAAQFVELWLQQPAEYRLGFANPPESTLGGVVPHISEKRDGEVSAYLDRDGGIYKIQNKDNFIAFCKKGRVCN
jgi:uncharacterized protein